MIIVNIKHEQCDVKIDRSSKWGNPFIIGRDGNREQVIEKYRVWLWEQIKAGNLSKADLLELDGKRCGCWCKPLACHGDVLVKAVQWAKS